MKPFASLFTPQIEGELVKTEPYTACKDLSTDVNGRVALVQRGGCMFIDKVSLLTYLFAKIP